MIKATFTTPAIFATAVLMPLLVASSTQAETCATPPTCTELGYTLTSTSNCAGPALKCPFDKTKYYCTEKSDAAAAAMPDYSKSYDRSLGVTYTATTSGVIYGRDSQRANSGDGNDGWVNIYINGRLVRGDGNVNWGFNTWSYPVKKGSTYHVNGGGNRHELWLTYWFSPSN